jgi:hypothetical protein
MPSPATLSIAPPSPHAECVESGGCSYLHALSTIEHIAGFEHTACRYATAAARCRERGCAAASAGLRSTRAPAATPVDLDALRPPPDLAAVSGSREAELIPFERSAMIDIASDSDGNYVERRTLKLDSLPKRGDSLGYLYRYWRDLRAASALQFSNVDTVHLARAGIIGKLHIVDVSSSDPGDFRYELFGYAVPVPNCNVLRALPIGIWSESLLRDYHTVRMTATPRLQRLRCSLGGTKYHYTRLILPFLGIGARVDRLAVAIRQEAGDGVRVDPGE